MSAEFRAVLARYVAWVPSLDSSEIPSASFSMSLGHLSNGAGVPPCGAARDEMTPSPRVRCLLNEPPSLGELAPKESGFDRVALRELTEKSLPVSSHDG